MFLNFCGNPSICICTKNQSITILSLAVQLFSRLRDESPQVRKNTMQVLTHLILNDMIKVKGQISEMATCIVDHDERISNLAKLFFHELSRKV